MGRMSKAMGVLGKGLGAIFLFPLSLAGLVISYLRGRHPDHPWWPAWDRWWCGVGWCAAVLLTGGAVAAVVIVLI